jgi:hypothetical protein
VDETFRVCFNADAGAEATPKTRGWPPGIRQGK